LSVLALRKILGGPAHQLGVTRDQAISKLAKTYNLSPEYVAWNVDNFGDLRNEFNKLTKTPKHLNISLPIAMAVTSYARIRLYEFKEIVGADNLLYSDTDSVFTSKPLPDNFIGKELGQMKLEYIAERAIYIAPKVYAIYNILVSDNKALIGTDIIKIKGAKKGHGLIFMDFYDLLVRNIKKIIHQLKFIKKVSMDTIYTYKALINLKLTEGKRAIIWQDDVFVATKPYIVNEDKDGQKFKTKVSTPPPVS
jgi:hypothetical protein